MKRFSLHVTRRLFVAIAPPLPVGERLAALAEPLRGFSWSRPDQVHLTLRFLGDVAVERIDAVAEKLRSVAVTSFVLPLEGVGAFPPRGRPRVLWAGIGRGHTRLHQLRQRVDDALLSAGLSLDVREFQPHVTLARLDREASPAAAAAAWLKRHAGFSGPAFRVEKFVLYSSELDAEGAVHTPIAEVALKEAIAAAARPRPQPTCES